MLMNPPPCNEGSLNQDNIRVSVFVFAVQDIISWISKTRSRDCIKSVWGEKILLLCVRKLVVLVNGTANA